MTDTKNTARCSRNQKKKVATESHGNTPNCQPQKMTNLLIHFRVFLCGSVARRFAEKAKFCCFDYKVARKEAKCCPGGRASVLANKLCLHLVDNIFKIRLWNLEQTKLE